MHRESAGAHRPARLRVVGHDDDAVVGGGPQLLQHAGGDAHLARLHLPPGRHAAAPRAAPVEHARQEQLAAALQVYDPVCKLDLRWLETLVYSLAAQCMQQTSRSKLMVPQSPLLSCRCRCGCCRR